MSIRPAEDITLIHEVDAGDSLELSLSHRKMHRKEIEWGIADVEAPKPGLTAMCSIRKMRNSRCHGDIRGATDGDFTKNFDITASRDIRTGLKTSRLHPQKSMQATASN